MGSVVVWSVATTLDGAGKIDGSELVKRTVRVPQMSGSMRTFTVRVVHEAPLASEQVGTAISVGLMRRTRFAGSGSPQSSPSGIVVVAPPVPLVGDVSVDPQLGSVASVARASHAKIPV